MTLDLLWYLVVIACMIFYTILDGFDLGVGILHLFAKGDNERRLFINSIGPLWDGNEVWLVVLIGGLFAGFPEVYATLLSGFYNMVMLLLVGFMFRAVAIECRSKRPSMGWRNSWDVVFSVASYMISFGIGLMLGNLILGVPLDAQKNFIGTMADLLRPYPILIGLMSVTLFTMHGVIYLSMKTEGSLHEKIRPWVTRSIVLFIVFYLLATVATLLFFPHMTDNMMKQKWLFLLPLAAFLAIANIPRQVRKHNDGWAFIFSCLAIALLMSLYAVGTYPVLVRSTVNPETNSLDIVNAASSPLTLKVLLVIVVIGIPLVLAYGFYIYKVFRGKIQLDEHSY